VNRLFVMCGLAFSGKSTLARSLAERLEATVVSLDEINRERGLPHGGAGLPVEAWAETHRIGLERLAVLMRGGGDLVADDTACFQFLRDGYRRLAAAHGYSATVVLVDPPRDEIAARRRRSDATADREPISDEVLAAHVASFEWPRDDETVVALRSAAEATAWLATLDPKPPPGR
jgi:predicted kinase